MKWSPGGESGDIEDRRDEGGGGGFQFGGIHIGLGGAPLLLILSFVFKTNLFALLGGGVSDSGTAVSQPDPARDEAEKPLVQFVSFVLDDTQNTWSELLPQQTGVAHRHAKLVLFRDYTQSGCGGAQSATGPFYCPGDEKVYIDLGFFDELNKRFGAPGQFAQAYVLAWAHSTQQRGLLEKGDVESALGAASAVGDDRLQKMSTGHVSPETFTHGTSQQRMRWFSEGLDNGTIAACNTFADQE